MTKYTCIVLAGSTWLLASCSSPFFADRLTTIDWAGPPAAGTIAVSHPKMYRRESLINERRDEVLWLNAELDDSKTKIFAPELLRETEEIKQFAAALGLNFDPASAVNYRRDSETGDVKHQIEVLKLQLQLDQLRRDANLMRAGLETQTVPVNDDLGKVTAAGPEAASSPTMAAATGKLTDAIDRINKDLSTRLGATAQPPASAGTTANPSDLFRDRNAYRDLLKAARNAASLDDLHDHGDSALIRLNFQAMVLPEAAHIRAPGVVQMTVLPPTLEAPDVQKIYRAWLDHLNGQINRSQGEGWAPNGELVHSKAADYFDLVYYRYPLPGSDAKTRAMCAGLSPDLALACGSLVFAVPTFKAATVAEGGYTTLSDYLDFGALGDDEAESERAFRKAHARILDHALTLVPACGLPQAAPAMPRIAPNGGQLLMRDIDEARQRAAGGDEFARIERQAQQLLRKHKIPQAADPVQARAIAARTQRAHRLLRTFEDAAYARCTPAQRASFRQVMPSLYVPPGFHEALAAPPRIAVYEIGPREQVQQVSTVSRVANNLSLALALAASKPGTGLGASAAANYSRQALGRAATIERVPVLIGYATTGDTFGWVVAPKAVLDPKGAIRLEQTPRALDLSVDLSVPGWWPAFKVVTTTGWALDAATITSGTVNLASRREFVVPMAANYADFDELTAQLQGSGAAASRRAVLDEEVLDKQFIAACHATSLYLRGDNIWRATSVVVGGHRLDDAGITVAPDMSGILVAVPALEQLVSYGGKPKMRFSVFTRSGDASAEVDYVPAPAQGGCKPQAKPADSTAPVIASVTPLEFKGGSVQWFTVDGANLGKFDRVYINGQPGVIEHVSKDGKFLKASFSAAQTRSLPRSRTIPLSFFAADKKLAERLVENRN